MNRTARSGIWAALAVLGSACASGRATTVQTPAAAPPQAALQNPRNLPAPTPSATTALRTLIVGGGPDRTHNQVAIESNVRYLGRLLPRTAQYRVLFADGDPESDNVQFRLSISRALAYRPPTLPRLDGSTSLPNVRAELAAAAEAARTRPDTDVLLYFTGHGSPDRPSTFVNNWFDVWNRGRFTVADMARSLQLFPAGRPITLVMVQCFSGAFANLQFEGGNPGAALVPQVVAGFFAAVPERVAAGCTPAVEEENYKDFTGYFFAALTGEDRMGKPVTGADYDRDGRVGMHEAFAWTLVHDDSIDTPICTSDTFLRRFAKTTEADLAATPYRSLRSWASPAQAAALDGLSEALRLGGDDRLRTAFDRRRRMRPNSMILSDVRLIRFLNLAQTVALAHDLDRSGEPAIKQRYAELLAAESRNPLR
jgi:hypothetical protein